MKMSSWLRARPRTLASVGVVSAVAVTLGALAFVYEGKPTTEVDLNDGGVWVTKQSSMLLGHFNHESRVLDGGLRGASTQFDIQQSASRVLMVDQVAGTATSVDPARVTLGDSAEIPAGSQVALGGDQVAIVDPAGTLRVADFSALGSFQPGEDDALAELGQGGLATVAVDGTVYAASAADATLYAFGRTADDALAVSGERTLEGVEPTHTLQLTAVGNTAYVLDVDTDTLHGSDGSRVEVPAGAALQLPSVDAGEVTLATDDALLRVPRGGGDIVTIPTDAGTGTPARPAYVAGCAYGAWSGSGAFVRDCAGEASDTVEEIEGLDAASKLQFRVNRDVVVLNDVFGGAAWMASDAMQRVDDWDDITPPEGEGDEQDETTEETVQTTLPERTEVNTPPVANDDSYGVRPGRSTILPVLENDTDADGDVLVATAEPDQDLGTVSQIYNGAALQIDVPEDAVGSTTFSYTVEDGRGGEATARVSVTVHGWDENAAPVQKRRTPIVVETGGTASYNVLSDWIDPDGDDIFLLDVAPDGGDEADFTSDGQITYRAIGGVAGRKEMPISVSDGTETGNGVAVYDIRPLGSTVPITNADHVVTRVGQPVVVHPLANDTSSGSEQLRLARVDVDGIPDATITPDFADRSFTFVSDVEKTFYVQYLASTGPNSVPGIVRVDVLPAADETLPPVAVRDVALLPAGGDVLVNVLSNDTDPAGGILVVQSVSAPGGTGAAAAVLGHETVRITDQGGVTGQLRVQYTISNGSESATGEIIVIPVPAPARLRPPVADDDEAVVRVGDVVTIPVLDNDYHPNGDVITLAPDLVAPGIDPADGEAFISEGMLRFRAGEEAKTVYATYEAVDSTGQKDAALVTIQILPRNDEDNTAPRPRDLTARVLAGSAVDIPVPLDGIDEDGDSVELVGVASAPRKGRIVSTGASTFRFEAFEDSFGTDSFTYRVRDRLGKEATATVQVGIAPVAAANQAPYAVRDAIVMRPSREVAVPVLANDSDPDGDGFTFAEDALEVPADVPGLKARVAGEYLLITSPAEELHTSVSYTIEDARGLRATASVQITVDEDVPLIPPIARDDRVLPEDVTDEGTAEVAVLDNDDDPDGTKSALEVTLGTGGENASVARDGLVRVTLTDGPQLITYTVRDRDDQTAAAFIRVPGLSQLPPSLIDATSSIEVASGETVEVPLAEYVRAAGGKSVVITEAGKVSAAHANGAPLVKDQSTLLYTSADRYFGADALTFEVTDGAGPDDPEGRKATLTIPIAVLPPENQQPTMVGAAMSVAAGEDPATLDLASLAADPDPGDADRLRFSLVGSAPAGLTASVDGTTLQVAADATMAKGTQATLTVRATDGQTDPVEAAIAVTVSASTRELASANDDVIEEADQGETISVPVLDNDVNPFPDTPLKISGAVTESGTATPRINGDRVEVTTPSDFVGTVVVRYRVLDKTEDVDRAVEGRIRITVQGRPDAPGKPTVSSVQSRTVVLSWTPPIDNGTPITGYTVTSARGDYAKECAATTCTLDGLTNNVEYNFTVTATNRVGESDPSVPSETARPDVRPETPAPPSLRFGDQSLDVSWTVPRTEGSPVERYTLEISPAPPSGVTQKEVTGTSTVWDGLENGVPYRVRVQAHNRAPEPSGFSPYSAAEIPARAPEAPGAPTTSRLDPVPPQAQIQVAWNAPAGNGDAVSGYELQVLQGSSVVRTIERIPAGQTSQAVVVNTSEQSYTFQVRAQNKAGWGQWSPASAPRRGVNEPGAPTAVGATAGDNTVAVTWQAGAGNGASAAEISYQYSVNGGGWQSTWAAGGRGGSGTIGGGQVNNNGAYTIRVRAVSTVDGATFASAPSADSNQVRPYGQIGNPTARATASGTSITYSWQGPADNGRAVTTQIRINGGGWETVGRSGDRSINVGHSYTGTIEVRASADGSQDRSASDSARTADAPPPPQPRAIVSRGSSAVGQPTCSSAACAFFKVTTRDFAAGNYRYQCMVDGRQFNRWEGPVYFPANGDTQLECYFGGPGQPVWVVLNGTRYETSYW